MKSENLPRDTVYALLIRSRPDGYHLCLYEAINGPWPTIPPPFIAPGQTLRAAILKGLVWLLCKLERDGPDGG